MYLTLAYSKGYKRIREGEVSQVSGLKCGGVRSMFVRPVGGSCNWMSVRVCVVVGVFVRVRVALNVCPPRRSPFRFYLYYKNRKQLKIFIT